MTMGAADGKLESSSWVGRKWTLMLFANSDRRTLQRFWFTIMQMIWKAISAGTATFSAKSSSGHQPFVNLCCTWRYPSTNSGFVRAGVHVSLMFMSKFVYNSITCENQAFADRLLCLTGVNWKEKLDQFWKNDWWRSVNLFPSELTLALPWNVSTYIYKKKKV